MNQHQIEVFRDEVALAMMKQHIGRACWPDRLNFGQKFGKAVAEDAYTMADARIEARKIRE